MKTDQYNVRMNTSGFALYSIVILLLGMLIGLVCKDSKTITIKETRYIDTCNYKPRVIIDTLTSENVYKEILENNIQFPKIVLMQSIIETGHYKSRLCKEQNNLFGFGGPGKFMKFDSWKSCIKFYKKYQDKYYQGGDYFKFLLDIGFADGEEYIKMLKRACGEVS